MTGRRLILASTSPRRRQMLTEARIPHHAASPGIDDGGLRPGRVTPEQWVGALAYLKARSGQGRLAADAGAGAIVLGADTIVVKDGSLVGQPKDRDDAASIIRRLRAGTHRVVTGVAVLIEAERQLFCDTATVHVGDITDDMIDAYLATDTWKGKAGAYNLAERMADGWPLRCDGDPTTVMGLPMQRLLPCLASCGIVPDAEEDGGC